MEPHLVGRQCFNVFAVELATHEGAWTVPLGGAVSIIGAGMLVVSGHGVVTAFHLAH